MAIDFQVVFPQQIIPLNSARIADNIGVRTLDITGDDFRAIDEVLVNGSVSPSIVVVSKSRLLAQVPAAALLQNITSIQIVSRKLVLTDKSLIKFQIGHTPSKVRGVLRLVQIFLKTLFTTQGTDIFNKRAGASGLRGLGRTFGNDEGGNIVSDFVLSVATASKQIIALQSRDSSIPRDEKLLSARVTRSAFNKNESALVVSVELTSQAGRAAMANVML
jgi:hypothetical protein